MTDAALTPTPNDCELPRRRSDFATFNEAIDYAARSAKGLNFHDMRGTLERVYPYAQMREDAIEAAYRLIAMGIREGRPRRAGRRNQRRIRRAVLRLCLMGAWPVPLPLPTTFGGKESYIDQLAVQLRARTPVMLIYPQEIAEMAKAAADRQGCDGEAGRILPARAAPIALPEAQPDDICYLQYSSGSTRFPTGVAVTHEALLHNLWSCRSMHIGTNDRVVSWLPWYHDMGLVGCFLSLIANQFSVDYLLTEHLRAARSPGST